MTTLENPGVIESLQTRLANVQAGAPALWGQMTAAQMVCHLADSYAACMGMKYVSPATGPVQRSLLKWVALYAPMQWPKGIKGRPEVEPGTGGTQPTSIEADRERLSHLLKQFANERLFSKCQHPIFGRLSDREWLRWGYLHMDHHLRQFGA